MDRATQYFNRQAAHYSAASARWPWAWLRGAERRAVMSLTGPLDGAEVLELGCGAGFYTRALLDAGAAHVWAVDRAEEMLRALPREGVTPVLGDAATVRLQRTFDLVLAAGMFEFAEPGPVLANAAAHAKPSARIVVLYSTPTVAGRMFRAFHAAHGVDARLYTWEEFDDAAIGTGWTIEGWQPCGLWGIAARFCRYVA